MTTYISWDKPFISACAKPLNLSVPASSLFISGYLTNIPFYGPGSWCASSKGGVCFEECVPKAKEVKLFGWLCVNLARLRSNIWMGPLRRAKVWMADSRRQVWRLSHVSTASDRPSHLDELRGNELHTKVPKVWSSLWALLQGLANS